MTILRGDIWEVNFNPTLGHEQSGRRPALIMSVDEFNSSGSNTVIAIPMTSKDKGIRTHIFVSAKEHGISNLDSFIICDQIRTISQRRLGKRLGNVSAATLKQVGYILQKLLKI
jgi:mRNA interferase MazF